VTLILAAPLRASRPPGPEAPTVVDSEPAS